MLPKIIKRFGLALTKMNTIDRNQNHKEMKIRFESIGWKSLLQTRGGTSRVLVLKSVVRGLCLERAMPIYSYVGEDPAGRPVMVSYLDGQQRIVTEGGI